MGGRRYGWGIREVGGGGGVVGRWEMGLRRCGGVKEVVCRWDQEKVK